MTILIGGVLLWSIVHLYPALAPAMRERKIEQLGRNRYRGLFTLGIVASLVLIVIGWRSTPEIMHYRLGDWSRPAGLVLMILSFVLIGAAHYQTAIRRYIRHPMLTGVAVWAASHLLTNGTTRAFVLFGGLGVWAVLEIVLISRREGPYTKPVSPGFSGELKGLFISAAIFLVALYLHPYFAGVDPFPG